jgi:hypothetical protein
MRKHKSPAEIHNPNCRKWITSAQLRERFGNVSEAWPGRQMEKDPDFPRFKKFGRYKFWNLAEIEQYERGVPAGAITKRYECNDCGVDVLKNGDWYMAVPELWEKRLGLGWNDNLCFACLEQRLGRKVQFPDDVLPIPIGVGNARSLNRVAPERMSARWMELFAPKPAKPKPSKRRQQVEVVR